MVNQDSQLDLRKFEEKITECTNEILFGGPLGDSFKTIIRIELKYLAKHMIHLEVEMDFWDNKWIDFFNKSLIEKISFSLYMQYFHPSDQIRLLNVEIR